MQKKKRERERGMLSDENVFLEKYLNLRNNYMSSEVKNAINTEEAFNPGLQVLKWALLQ